jgi:DNA polymerase III subunit epsilon
MRQIVLDTETTGLEVEQGHRIIEIGCIELERRRPTRNHFHQYLNPEREIDPGAVEVHGLTNEFLAPKPRFVEVARALWDYLQGAELIIHNAPFDLGFLNIEFARAGFEAKLESVCTVIDTVALARRLLPGQRVGLDALCKRYGVDNSSRDFHGALLDARLLADVYLAMTGGQSRLALDEGHGTARRRSRFVEALGASDRPLPVLRPTEAEWAAHCERLAGIAKKAPLRWADERLTPEA